MNKRKTELQERKTKNKKKKQRMKATEKPKGKLFVCLFSSFFPFPHFVLGYQVTDILNQAIWVANNRRAKLKTHALMRCISTSMLIKPPPAKRGKRLKIKFATQADVGVRRKEEKKKNEKKKEKNKTEHRKKKQK